MQFLFIYPKLGMVLRKWDPGLSGPNSIRSRYAKVPLSPERACIQMIQYVIAVSVHSIGFFCGKIVLFTSPSISLNELQWKMVKINKNVRTAALIMIITTSMQCIRLILMILVKKEGVLVEALPLQMTISHSLFSRKRTTLVH